LIGSSARFLLTNHASVVLRERGIPVEWVRRVMAHPCLCLPDAEDPEVLHALAPIVEREDRVLRVVYNEGIDPLLVVTAYFDRAWRGLL
jgi:hypothetical protein